MEKVENLGSHNKKSMLRAFARSRAKKANWDNHDGPLDFLLIGKFNDKGREAVD